MRDPAQVDKPQEDRGGSHQERGLGGGLLRGGGLSVLSAVNLSPRPVLGWSLCEGPQPRRPRAKALRASALTALLRAAHHSPGGIGRGETRWPGASVCPACSRRWVAPAGGARRCSTGPAGPCRCSPSPGQSQGPPGASPSPPTMTLSLGKRPPPSSPTSGCQGPWPATKPLTPRPLSLCP